MDEGTEKRREDGKGMKRKKSKQVGVCSLVVGTNATLLADVDSIEELTDILFLDTSDVVDLGGGLGHLLEVVSGEDDLVLDVGRANGDSVEHVDGTVDLLTQEVDDLDDLSVVTDGGRDGEVCVDKAHLVLESLGDTEDQVVDVRADGADASDVLLVSKPDLNNDLSVSNVDVRGEVLERTGEGSTGANNGDLTGLHGDGDCVCAREVTKTTKRKKMEGRFR